jgi:U4/U6.U5 tri-snRNP-associated protein 1
VIYSEDELQNVEMAEEERTKKNNEMKIKRDYTGYDDDEFTAGNEGMKRAVLAKYDEDIESSRDTVGGLRSFQAGFRLTHMQGFRLGSSATASKGPREQQEEGAASVNKSLLSIDYASE